MTEKLHLTPEEHFPEDLAAIGNQTLQVLDSQVQRQLDYEVIAAGEPHPETEFDTLSSMRSSKPATSDSVQAKAPLLVSVAFDDRVVHFNEGVFGGAWAEKSETLVGSRSATDLSASSAPLVSPRCATLRLILSSSRVVRRPETGRWQVAGPDRPGTLFPAVIDAGQPSGPPGGPPAGWQLAPQ